MYYMHLKNDSKLFSGVFVFPLIIAAVIILGAHRPSGVPLGIRALGWMTPLLARAAPRRAAAADWSRTSGAWSLHPSVLIGTGLLGALYFWGIGPLRRRHDLGPPAEPLAGRLVLRRPLLVLLLSLNGPMHDLSDYYLFSAHMVQHLLLTLRVPAAADRRDSGLAARAAAPARRLCARSRGS